MKNQTELALKTLNVKFKDYSDRALLEKQTYDIQEARKNTSTIATILSIQMALIVIGIIISIIAYS